MWPEGRSCWGGLSIRLSSSSTWVRFPEEGLKLYFFSRFSEWKSSNCKKYKVFAKFLQKNPVFAIRFWKYLKLIDIYIFLLCWEIRIRMYSQIFISYCEYTCTPFIFAITKLKKSDPKIHKKTMNNQWKTWFLLLIAIIVSFVSFFGNILWFNIFSFCYLCLVDWKLNRQICRLELLSISVSFCELTSSKNACSQTKHFWYAWRFLIELIGFSIKTKLWLSLGRATKLAITFPNIFNFQQYYL